MNSELKRQLDRIDKLPTTGDLIGILCMVIFIAVAFVSIFVLVVRP